MVKKFLFAGLLGLFTLCSCLDDNAVSANTSQAASSGSWRVTLFTDSGNNETAHYNGYNFTFSQGGTLSVTKSGVTQTGTWSVSTSSNKFNIDLGPKSSSNILGEFTEDWKILSSSETEIRLGDDNSSSNEFLTFTKN
jgi:hypothetical protein